MRPPQITLNPAGSLLRARIWADETTSPMPCHCVTPSLELTIVWDPHGPNEALRSAGRYAQVRRASVEQARHAFDRFISAAHEAITDIEGRAESARTRALDAGGRATSFAERNMAASFALAQKLVHAKDVEEVARLQTEIGEGSGSGSQRADQGTGGGCGEVRQEGSGKEAALSQPGIS